ncbi:MAG: hypothetical protein EOP66_02050 [Sphingomonas sp.]|nr:MAG: hypothetical protein EOP66_02050 [Sphingomonas sp.]
MTRWPFLTAAAIVGLAHGSASLAQTLISRKYVLDRTRSSDVFHVIADAAHQPAGVGWPDLRRRLYKSSLPTDGFRITDIAGRIAISDNTPRPIIDVFAGGAAMKWKINDGQILDVSATVNGEAVIVLYRGSDYDRTTTYRNVGQQLVADTIIVGPGLSAPIRYKLVYN